MLTSSSKTFNAKIKFTDEAPEEERTGAAKEWK